MSAAYDLHRFVEAQEGVYESVLTELKAGRKRGHWMWYIFPQIRGLGESFTAQQYAISSRDEAAAYAEHAILGPRLSDCTHLVLQVEGRSAEQIFRYPDYLKFRSCLTLFQQAAGDNGVFQDALIKYFDGVPDPLTLGILKKQQT